MFGKQSSRLGTMLPAQQIWPSDIYSCWPICLELMAWRHAGSGVFGGPKQRSGVWRRDHTMPTLRRLHWLPVQQRVLFKIAVLVYQWLNGLAPSYLADDCQLVSDARPFVWLWILHRPTYPHQLRRPVFRCRWPTSVELLANRTETIWQSCGQFKWRSKTHLFGLWDHRALWHWLLVNQRHRNILTYLLTSENYTCPVALRILSTSESTTEQL